MNIGENIKNMRRQRNIKQSELAERLGITQSMLCQIERGTKAVSMPLRKQIAEEFNCNVDDLFNQLG